MPDKAEPLAVDLLHGAAEIAAFLGLTERQAFHQIEQGNIPTTRMGRLIVASKSALRRRFVPQDSEPA
jgi:hypothetical protein